MTRRKERIFKLRKSDQKDASPSASEPEADCIKKFYQIRVKKIEYHLQKAIAVYIYNYSH